MISLIVLLLAVHLFFTLRTRVIQRHVLRGVRYSFTSAGQGVGTYAAFAAALGTTVGPGNVTGVAVAIAAGGAGAVFWMWVCGVLAMATKYAESYLALRYRDGACGGTMVLLSREGYPRLSKCWSLCCGAGGLLMGAAIPSRSLADALPLPPARTAVLLCLLLVITLAGGLSGVARVSSLLVPVMSVLFMAACVAVCAMHYRALPGAFGQIFLGALSLKSAGAGALAAAVKSGVTRGLYSNESGLGTGGVLAAESGDAQTEMSALAAMTTVLWDTVVMCVLTGVTFVCCGAARGCDPQAAVAAAFGSVPYGGFILAVSMSLFVFATVIGWYYIAVRAMDFAFGESRWYAALYLAAAFCGALLPAAPLWKTADGLNAALLFPTLFILCKKQKDISLQTQ